MWHYFVYEDWNFYGLYNNRLDDADISDHDETQFAEFLARHKWDEFGTSSFSDTRAGLVKKKKYFVQNLNLHNFILFDATHNVSSSDQLDLWAGRVLIWPNSVQTKAIGICSWYHHRDKYKDTIL